MQTYLLVSVRDEFLQKHLDHLVETYEILPFNIHSISPNPSIGIADVRKLIALTKLKPLGGGERLIVIKKAELATLEAANALLKLLEEPPNKTHIVLTTSNIHLLLETIVSRCIVIRGPTRKENEVTPTFAKEFSSLLTASPGKRVAYSQEKINSRGEALEFIEMLISALSTHLSSPKGMLPLGKRETAQSIKRAESARLYLARNINFKATMDVFLMGLPKISISSFS
ncbi:hypothetical protein HYW55_01620 [Candidatus Gottesmanbacteria bacterium]|nr:hypothetical protein [Candidatus Gottesmanbacteria bacterium]